MLKKLLRKGADVKEPSGKTRNLIIHDILHMCFDTPKRKKLISKDRRRYVVYMFKYAIKYGVDMNKINTHSETGVSLLEKLEKLENAEEVKKIRSIYMKSLLKGEVDSEETNESNREEARKISTCEEDEGELDSEGLGQTFTKQEIDMEIREELENEEMSNGEVVEDLTETSFEDCCTTIQNEENNGNSQIPAGCENVCSDSKVTSILVKRSATAPPFDHVYQRSFTDAPEIENPIFDLPEVNQPKRDPPQESEPMGFQQLDVGQNFANLNGVPNFSALGPLFNNTIPMNQSRDLNSGPMFIPNLWNRSVQPQVQNDIQMVPNVLLDLTKTASLPNSSLNLQHQSFLNRLLSMANQTPFVMNQPIQIPPVPVIPSASLYAPNLIPQLNFINPPSLPISNPVFNLPSQPGFFNTQF